MKKNFEIYYTSDVHGSIFPVDYAGGREKRCGILNYAAEIVKTGNTLVLDGGDSLQGTPLLSYYLEHREDFPYQPMAEAFGEAGLDCFTLGNHDFNFGYAPLRDYVCALREKGADCVCANVRDLRGGIPLLPYVIRTLANGLRVGITGLVTDYVKVWEDPAHLVDLEITDPLEKAEEMLRILRGQCDVTVCIYHGGYEEELESGKKLSESRENVACALARRCRFDLLLTGHQHMATEGRQLYGSYTVQLAANLEHYFRISGEAELAGGTRTALRIRSQRKPVGTEHGADCFRRLSGLEARTEAWLSETIGRLPAALPPEEKLEIALHGSRVAALFNQIQLLETGADFSCTGLGNAPIGLPRELSIRSIYTAYPFANTIIVKEVTRESLRAALERCAMYLELDGEGKPRFSDAFMKPKVEHYNYDFYAGLDYAFDLRKPAGERVVRLRRLDGTELQSGSVYRLALSNYRATGTGGYPMLGAAREVYSGADNVQDLLIAYIRRAGELSIPKNYRFSVRY